MFYGTSGYHAKSYASTDLVETPENYLSRNKKTLLVNFGRSGNSPESVGSVQVADEVCKGKCVSFIHYM